MSTSEQPNEGGEVLCANCTIPHPIWQDDDGTWLHADSETAGCGSWAPDGDDGTSAAPAARQEDADA